MSENLDSSLPKSSIRNQSQELPGVVGTEAVGIELSKAVLVELPPALAKIVQHCSQESGQTKAAVIVAMLKSLLGLTPDFPGVSTHSAAIAERLQTVESRLSQLESLGTKLEDLEGKLLAF